jgi:hypothetical protein
VNSVPAAYRKLFVQLAPVLVAGLAVLVEADSESALNPLGMGWQVIVAAAGAALVYLPSNPWLKALFSLIATIAGSVTAILTDGLVTGTEVIHLMIMIASFVGVGAVPNSTGEVVYPADGGRHIVASDPAPDVV